MQLKDKVCVVTGGSSGIGEAIVKAFTREGGKVAFSYLTKRQRALRIANLCKTTHIYQVDVRSRNDIKKMFNSVFDKFGRIDVLVNNAGINLCADFDKQTDSEWQDVIDVDLTGVFRSCQEILPYISDGGSIINIGSLSGEYGGPRTPSYAAAKAGVMALTHCLARFLGPRFIRVNCISPGIIGNEFTEKTMAPQVRELLGQLLLIKRYGNVVDVASLAVFLASDASSYITAQTLSVNGGAWA